LHYRGFPTGNFETTQWKGSSERGLLMLVATRFLALFGLLALAASLAPIRAQQPLETETARPPKEGSVEIQAAFEYQTSKEGTERALPFAFEYGITDRLSLMVEPVFYTAIRPKVGPRATGVGDLEVTLSYLFAREKGWRPALAIAGEVKAPTARNVLIGTRKTDFATYLIASKRAGKFDTHANIGYTFVGKPAGAQLKNFVNFALAEEYFVHPKFALVGEVLINSGSSPEAVAGATTPPPTVTPEISSGEIVGMGGFRYRLRERLFFTFGVSYDNNHAVLIRPGLTFTFNRPGRTRTQ
jgi:hypothetical protein